MSVDQASLGWGSMPATLLSDDSRLSIWLRAELICSPSEPLVMNTNGTTTSGTSGASSQKWYLTTRSTCGLMLSGI